MRDWRSQETPSPQPVVSGHSVNVLQQRVRQTRNAKEQFLKQGPGSLAMDKEEEVAEQTPCPIVFGELQLGVMRRRKEEEREEKERREEEEKAGQEERGSSNSSSGASSTPGSATKN